MFTKRQIEILKALKEEGINILDFFDANAELHEAWKYRMPDCPHRTNALEQAEINMDEAAELTLLMN